MQHKLPDTTYVIMYAKQAQLKATVAMAALLGAVILFAGRGSYGGSQQRSVRRLSAITKGGEIVSDKLQSLSTMIHAEGAADIWLINQPKCGTNYLERVISSGMDCKRLGKEERTWFSDCGNDKMFFRTHFAESATRFKTLFDLKSSRDKARAGRCVAISAVRNPLKSIPSRFFESYHADALCDGSKPLKDVLKMYEEYLAKEMPASQVQTIAGVLRIFAGKNVGLYQALSMLAENGVAFFNEAGDSSPWAGCELILLQIDHDEDGMNVDHTMDVLFPRLGPAPNWHRSRSRLCPNAMENIEAVYNYELTDQHLDVFAQYNPEMRDLFRYYRENPYPRSAQAASIVSALLLQRLAQ